jgi:LPS export ABC transporter protein LptC
MISQNKYTPIALSVLGISLLITVSSVFSSCSEAAKNFKPTKKDTLSLNEYAETVTIEFTDSGLLRARMFSPLLIASKNSKKPYVLMKKGLKVDFYNPEGQLESYLTAEYGISFPKEKKVKVQRNVEILNTKGETLNTEELIWDQETGTIRTDKFVKITGKDQITQGTGLISNQSFTDWEIINYQGTINIPHDQIPRPRPLIPGRGRY